ncbi:AcrR family transcriptional regulator [Pseudarthrobacter defluvii]|jgi:TetR/AcrR family transcriptional repressor of lmrAB and yxaGH operons|uniref:TetR/AcrR family transcriptional regulator n=1 Tax=Micrococcaceae TaxID=1268 RepID=UPI0006F6CEAC|nr:MULTISPECIES: TetR/AcrR family transcriptional regulator [Micrococcaceae]KRE73014.1 TetR family transcriptional regulator [Arthrobacter sp. Soil761]MDQ0769389.1 AcrR family transcriptional regulator [Pseudarthrobacter defluvii]TDT78357.1 TetR family transcriptional regulator [Arthrobacter sp. AG258]TWD56111.1 TetR family transcriptional regulator [Arthrobacter sp. AG367]
MSASNKPLSLRERNRMRTRGDILDTAAELLSSEGYASTALEVLSQQAGISRGTIYAHFPGGRDEIVREVYLRIADAVYVRGISLRDPLTDPGARITALATALVEATKEPKGRFYGVMGPDLVSALSDVMGSTSRSFEELIARDLKDAKDSGTLPEDAPTEALAATITGAIRAAGAAAAREPANAGPAVAAIRLLMDGLLVRATV